MFGRGKTQMSQNDKFVLAKGRQVGNLKAPMKKNIPLPAAANPVHKGRTHLGSMGKVKLAVK